MTNATPESWSEKAKVAIAVEGGSDVNFESLTETIDIDISDKDIEAIVNTKGGNLVKYMPQGITPVTLEAYPLEAGTASGTTGKGFFHLMQTNSGSSQPLSIPVTTDRIRVRIAILWTNDTTNTGADAAVTSGSLGLRFVGCGFVIGAKPSFTDGALKWTIQIKIPPFKKDGTANLKIDSTDATAAMKALGSFTATLNWSSSV